jgi:hypothetical protein
MAKQNVRRTVIRDWMSRPAAMRQSTEQAAQFARKAVEQHKLPPGRQAPYIIMMSWLRPRTGLA